MVLERVPGPRMQQEPGREDVLQCCLEAACDVSLSSIASNQFFLTHGMNAMLNTDW